MKVIWYGCLLFTICLAVEADITSDPNYLKGFKVTSEYEEFANYRTKFKRITDFKNSGLHWQQFVVIYTNTEIYEKNYAEYYRCFVDEDYDEDDDEPPSFVPYKPGDVIVKENYADESNTPSIPLTLTIMKKMPAGYDPKYGDWRYIQLNIEGKTIVDGNSDDASVYGLCIDCHKNIESRDFIFTNHLDQG